MKFAQDLPIHRIDTRVIHHAAFLALAAVGLLVFCGALLRLFELAVDDSRYSHIAVIPMVWVCIIWVRRERVFAHCQRCAAIGAPLVAAGLIAYAAASARSAGRDGGLSMPVSAIVLAAAGAFLLCYGARAFRAAMPAFGFLLFLIPLPAALLDHVNSALQHGSADVAYCLLKLAGLPVLRSGATISLPGLEAEVTTECSGLRSAFALLIAGLLAGYFLLRTAWARGALALMVVPLAVAKNGLRIATISWLTSYVDPAYIASGLHRRGGLPFSLLAIPFLVAAILLLRKCERRTHRPRLAEVP